MTACRVLCRGCLVAAALMIVVTSAVPLQREADDVSGTTIGNTEGTTTDVPTTTEQDDAETESVEDSTIPATAPKIEAIQEPENPDLQDKKAESRTLEVSSTERDDAKIETVTESVTNSAGETGTEAVEQSSDPITEQSALESETTTESHDLTTQEPETETEESTDVEIETVKESRIEKLEFVVPETLEQGVDPIRSEENNDIIKTETFASEIPHHEAVETETVKASETSETTEKTEVVPTGETLDQSQDPRNEEQETIIKTQTPDDSTIPEGQQHEILATETVEEPVVPRSDQDASNDLETGKQARIDNIEQVETRTEPVQEPINPTTNQPETVVPAEGLDQSTNPNDVTENPDAMEQITVKENIEKLLQDDEHQESFTQENHQTDGDSDANPTTTEAVVDSTETFLKELEAMIVTENDEVQTTDKSQEEERDILTGTTHHSPEKTDGDAADATTIQSASQDPASGDWRSVEDHEKEEPVPVFEIKIVPKKYPQLCCDSPTVPAVEEPEVTTTATTPSPPPPPPTTTTTAIASQSINNIDSIPDEVTSLDEPSSSSSQSSSSSNNNKARRIAADEERQQDEQKQLASENISKFISLLLSNDKPKSSIDGEDNQDTEDNANDNNNNNNKRPDDVIIILPSLILQGILG